MLYNVEKEKIKTITDCFTCKHFDKTLCRCVDGLNKICYEYDPATQIIIDGLTKLPLKTIKKEN